MKIVTVRHDSPLGRWTNSEWRPPHLAGAVEKVWYSEGTLAHRGERILPNGTVELIVNLGDPYRLVEPNGLGSVATTSLFGMQSGPILIEQPARHSVLGIRLRPAGAYALLARPIGDVSELAVDLHSLVGRAAGELAERCHAARSAAERLAIAAAWVSERVGRSSGVDPSIAWVAGRLERSGGTEPIAALREQTGLSTARLSARFREQIGVGPKRYARIVRFRRVVAMLHAGARPLAEVAAAAGYYDQPHLNAEFRELSGLTPRAFLAVRYPDSITAAEPAS